MSGAPLAAPAVSFVAEPNAVMTAGHSVTVTGLGFATLDATASARVGVSSCTTAAWGSATSARCLMAAGEGSSKHVGLTVESVVGTRTVGFSYDGTREGGMAGLGDFTLGAPVWRRCVIVHEAAEEPARARVRCWAHLPRLAMPAPVVSFVDLSNAGMTAGWSVTVSGLSFGASTESTPTVALGLTSCATAAWASATSVVCAVIYGDGVRHVATATVFGVVGTRTAAFSYDGLRRGSSLLLDAAIGHINPQGGFRRPFAR